MINRRHFLISSGAFLASANCKLHALGKTNEIILGGGKYLDININSIRHVLSIVNLNDQSQELINTDFLPHGIHRNPAKMSTVALFEKKGPGACEFDLNTKKITRSIQTKAGRYFYGHGAYNITGDTLFSTETELKDLKGVIGIRNTKDMSYLGEFPTYGLEPHECKLIDHGKTLVVTNGGGDFKSEPPSVVYIDVNSQQLIESVQLTNKSLNAGHLAVAKDGSLVVVSAPRFGLGKSYAGGVSIRPKGKSMKSIGVPEKITQELYGEALSIVIIPNKGVAAGDTPHK